jgi:hypothetical protein
MVRFPEMRMQLIFTLRTLADSEYQRRVWVEGDRPRPEYEDSLDQAVHIIFDDLSLNTHLDRARFSILCDETELEAVDRVVQAVDRLLKEVGLDCSDEDYITSDIWQEVISSSKYAYELLTDGDNPLGLYEELAQHGRSKA